MDLVLTILALASLVFCGVPLMAEAVTALVKERRITAALLISTAMVACVAIGQLFAAGEVAFIMALGEKLEDWTVRRARKGLHKLVALVPAIAHCNGSELPVEQLRIGDSIEVRPGETVPVDGVVTEGETTIDQSTMTGESVPVAKGIGAEVYSGTINQFGAIRMRVTKVGSESSLQKLIRMVKAAEYKEARTELQRLIAPLLAILCPVLFIVILCVVTEITGKAKTTIQVDIARTQDDQTLDTETEETEIDTKVDITEIDITVDTPSDMPSQVTDVVTPSLATPNDQALKQPDVNSVSLVKSPVQMKSIFGETRSAAARSAALQRYGGDNRTEEAVINALRWLKTIQKSDGHWDGNTGADGQGVTGLVLLTFLAHGEKSGGGEFGVCVSKGLEWLMKHRENLDPVGTHALAEAYGFLRNPNLKDAATEAVKVLADKLVATKWGREDDKGLNTRPLLLRMAFQTMALKSAQMSGIAPPNLQGAFDRLKEGFLIQGNQKDGGFSSDYYGPPRKNYRRTGIWHFMVGVVGLQYLGYGDMPIVERTMKILDDDWEMPTLGCIDSSCCPVRGNYWATMVFFNGGGKRWKNWNSHMINTYCRGQTVKKNAYTDIRGVSRSLGYWTCEDMHVGTSPVAPTCWVALQLMVYYRYLPTSGKGLSTPSAKPKPKEPTEDKSDVGIEVDI